MKNIHWKRMALMALSLNLTGSSLLAEAREIIFPDKNIGVYGLAWFKEDQPAISRLPLRLKKSFRKELWELAANASGARLRFKTNSKTLTLNAQCDNPWQLYNFSAIGQSGYDLYVNGRYKGSTGEVPKDCVISHQWKLEGEGDKEITLYLPLYKGSAIKSIVVDKDSTVEKPRPYRSIKPVVYYGTSVTQGGCASNPGMSFAAILERRLDVDFINLGFSGNGHGDISVAEAMTEIDSSLIVLDYWGNVSPEKFKATLPGFVDVLRKKHPTVPIIVTGPYYMEGADLVGLKTVAENFVRGRKEQGDKFISFTDLSSTIHQGNTEALTDGAHPNTYGFVLLADTLEQPVKKALGLR